MSNQPGCHYSSEDFSRFREGKMSEDEQLIFMTHIGNCTYCAQSFADAMEQDLAPVPPDFKRDLMTETSRIRKRKTSAKQTFYRYCFQVSFSMCAAIALNFSRNHLDLSLFAVAKIPKKNFSITAYVNDKLENFTDTLSDTISISWEELIHDKKEK